MEKRPGYGLPLRCPKCPPGEFYGMLKRPGIKAVPCPDCGSQLIATRSRAERRGLLQITDGAGAVEELPLKLRGNGIP